MGNENTHIANACTGEIRIYFQSMKLHIQEIAIDVTTDSGVSVKDEVEAHLNAGTKLHVVLKPDTRIQYLRCVPREVSNIPSQGDLYVTVTCNRGSKEELMCYNLFIPSDRSIIVIDNGMVKFAKYGHLWMDEEGQYW
ncbi:hypothetical protein GDO81_023365 [Engystomops pustulosus]|uniref:Uncharacterized protein n=1 Tax=Engystomops pustulosus TaxID=76066 RepID=A0AAV6YLK1_ENGPU|nr:hypothetical protein GDO81_023365 [Engystomops pustulosus]